MQQRRLVLVRHASAGSAAVDADRQLTAQGAREAAAVGRWLAAIGVVPDRVAVSPARRARQTWDHVAEALPSAPHPALDERLYENMPDSVLSVVRGTGEDVGTLVVVGHNPSVGHLARVLDGGSGDDPDAGSPLDGGFPPGTAAVFELAAPFEEVEAGGATVVNILLPSRWS